MRSVPVGAYSVVMATGIIAVAAHENHCHDLAVGFGLAAAALYLVLLGLGAALPGHVRVALRDPAKGFTILTFVAATDVLASIAGGPLGAALLIVAVAALILLGRPLAHRVRGWPPALARGNWLLAVVALQSVVVVAALLGSTPLVDAAVAVWCVGLLLYVVIAGRLVGRLRHHHSAADFAPDWWILMGALAISALAGAHLLDDLPTGIPLDLPVRVTSLVALAVGTLAIPLLVILDTRRLVRTPARFYELARWAMVFPLGMCAAAGRALADATGRPLLARASEIVFWCAVAVWAVTALGAVHLALTHLPPRRQRR